MSDIGSRNDAELRQRLLHMTTATATHLLNLNSYNRQFMTGAVPNQQGGRTSGRAVTVRLGPARPDLSVPEEARQQDALWRAVESITPGDMLVIDCGGDVQAGTTGDILAARVKRLGGVGIVVDGALRDAAQIRDLVGLACWSRGVHGSGFNAALVTLDMGLPVRCFGVTVRPGDYILADDDGLVVIPAALAEDVSLRGSEVELKETFIRGLIEQGVPIVECYPPSADVLRRFEVWRASARSTP